MSTFSPWELTAVAMLWTVPMIPSTRVSIALSRAATCRPFRVHVGPQTRGPTVSGRAEEDQRAKSRRTLSIQYTARALQAVLAWSSALASPINCTASRFVSARSGI
ncbi:hypothetical protein ASF58_10820 [Methylobacterium sp. Leaf125]|uniref:hypothetical protein n=1 Tax=Methylobacterium sp. Leaf125 TaxID=1736265 RepID=UPI0006F27BDA|nr:hypothetical protein [Methylobacterium sp. Leaf125]KQQ35903.1 hypothetical protein ASF58_10820 [Methylobacterium sp. Leaf125]